MRSRKIGIGILVLIIAVAVGASIYMTNSTVKSHNNEKKIEVTSSGHERTDGTNGSTSQSSEEKQKDDELTKAGALEVTTKMLKELQKSPEPSLTLANRMDKVSNDKDKVFTKEGWEYIHLSDFMETDPRGYKLAAQSLLSVIHAIEESGNKDMKPSDVDLSGVIYFDEKLKVAYVPVDLFTNAPTNLSFEMVYLDGKWVLQPYSLIAQIAIRTMEKSAITTVPEGQKLESTESEEETKESNTSADKEKAETHEKTKDSSK